MSGRGLLLTVALCLWGAIGFGEWMGSFGAGLWMFWVSLWAEGLSDNLKRG